MDHVVVDVEMRSQLMASEAEFVPQSNPPSNSSARRLQLLRERTQQLMNITRPDSNPGVRAIHPWDVYEAAAILDSLLYELLNLIPFPPEIPAPTLRSPRATPKFEPSPGRVLNDSREI